MAFQFAYQLQTTNAEGISTTTNIYDTLSGTGTTFFLQLEGAEDAHHIFITDNEESKYSPIKAKQMEIKFISTSAVNLNSFIDSADNRWYVEHFVGANLRFCGFLVLDDVDEDFLDSDAANIVTLIATDNVGLLKDEPLTMPNGANPRGYFSIIQYIAWCLQKTGLQLPINVVHNVREEHTPSKIMYESCFLQAKTFEKDINVSTDCYPVLEAILKQDAFLTQAGGEWWIIRVDEMQDDAYTVNTFDSNGNFVSSTTTNPVQVIDPAPQILQFSENATFVKIQQACKSVQLTYSYQYPKEVVDNIDFSRGGAFSVISVPGGTAYHLADWTTVGGPEAYIKRIFTDGYEKERYVVIPQSNGSQDHYIQSNPIPMHANDKFYFNIDWRLTTDLTSAGNSTVFAAQIRLFGDDGTFWTVTNSVLGTEPAGSWVQSNASFTTNSRYIGNVYTINQFKETDYMSASVQATPLPVSGNLVILIREYSANGKRETQVANLSFNYIPYINGSYAKYTGQSVRVWQGLNTKKIVDESVSISDSPKKLFKGALFYFNGTAYVLSGRFYDGRQFGSTVPASGFLHPFGHNQAYAVWNQNNRSFRIFDFQLQGLNGSGLFPEITQKYQINETTPHTTNKTFQMLHYDQDIKLCSWKGVMCEVFDNVVQKDYASPFEFKYISES